MSTYDGPQADHDVRVEYVIVSERASDGVTTTHERPFPTLEEAVDRLVWNYRWQENNMRVEARTVTVSPLASVSEFDVALSAALTKRAAAIEEPRPLTRPSTTFDRPPGNTYRVPAGSIDGVGTPPDGFSYDTIESLAASANLSMPEAWARLDGFTTNHLAATDPLSEADASTIRALLSPAGYADCGCDPRNGHTSPCLLAD